MGFEKTILLTGFPSSGKSSFMNKITNANVEVASYPFTTKSLYVGHCDYNYLRYQIIDSPGILDRPLSQRNTIEMQAITALAHLNCAILYFIDLSPFTNYSIQNQCKLFHSLTPLFGNKPIIAICNKIDLRTFDQLSESEKSMISKIGNMKNVKMMQMSNESEMNIMNVRNEACDLLLSHRIEIKTSSSGKQMENVQNRLFVAQPIKRDNKIRASVKVPPSLKKDKKSIKQIENEQGGPGVFNFDTRQHWNLKNDEWKFDPIPQFYDGHNIADFYQKNIDKELNDLEEEEEKREMNDLMMIDQNEDDQHELSADDQLLARFIRRKHYLMRKETAHQTKMRSSRPQIPRTDKKMPLKQMRDSLEDLGINIQKVSASVKEEESKKDESLYHRRGRSRARDLSLKPTNQSLQTNKNEAGLDFQELSRMQRRSKSRSKSMPRSRSKSKSRPPSKGISSSSASHTAQVLKRKAIMSLNKRGKVHESDRHIYNPKPLHLFKGKKRTGR